jgi:hypothetical protein
LDLDESIGRKGVLGDGQAIVGKGGKVEFDGFMGHLYCMLVVAAPGDAALEGRDGHGISPFGFGGEVDTVSEGLHCGTILLLGNQGSRSADAYGILKESELDRKNLTQIFRRRQSGL